MIHLQELAARRRNERCDVQADQHEKLQVVARHRPRAHGAADGFLRREQLGKEQFAANAVAAEADGGIEGFELGIRDGRYERRLCRPRYAF